MAITASGLIKTAVPVKVISARRGRLVVCIDGTRQTLHAGDTLVVHAEVGIRPAS